MNKLILEFEKLNVLEQKEFIELVSHKYSNSKNESYYITRFSFLISTYESCLNNYLENVRNDLYHSSAFAYDENYRTEMTEILDNNKKYIGEINKSLFDIYNLINEDYNIMNYKDNITIFEKIIESFMDHDVTYCVNFERIFSDNKYHDKSLYGLIHILMNHSIFNWEKYVYLQTKYKNFDDFKKFIDYKSKVNPFKNKQDNIKLYQNKIKKKPKFDEKFIDEAYVIREYNSDYDEIVEFNKPFNPIYFDVKRNYDKEVQY